MNDSEFEELLLLRLQRLSAHSKYIAAALPAIIRAAEDSGEKEACMALLSMMVEDLRQLTVATTQCLRSLILCSAAAAVQD